MKKILIFINGNDGCKLHRLILPYIKLQGNEANNFQIDFLYQTGQTVQELTETALQYDVFIYHRLIDDAIFDALKGKVILVNDEDDYWSLNSTHPLYSKFRNSLSERILRQIKESDYITTTTELMANKIRKINNNVAVFPNALENTGQFESIAKSSKYIRIGWVGGSSHVADIRMLDGLVRGLPQDVKDKVQFVLCGFDGGKRYIQFPDGHTEVRDMPYETTCWGEFERIFTDNYKNVSEEYKNFLLQFIPQQDLDADEHYRRIWTKPITSYAYHYDNMDIVLIPLRKDFFNESKSPLKLIESSIKHKAVIISDVEPYKDIIRTAVKKGGEIDTEGNCIAIADNKNVNAWIKAVTKLVRDEELRNMIADNLKKLTDDGAEFNLNTVCNKREKWLNEICEKI